jgi:hypothetical protein
MRGEKDQCSTNLLSCCPAIADKLRQVLEENTGDSPYA